MLLKDALGTPEDKNVYGTSNEVVFNDSFLGIELEMEKVSPTDMISRGNLDTFFWQVKGDGSLRNGCELVFNRPTKGANLIKALDSLTKTVEKLKSDYSIEPVMSERTSMHIHLDVRDMTFEEINELILLYMFFEGVIFEYVGVDRMKNNYCRPLIGSSFNTILTDLIRSHSESRSYLEMVSCYCDKYSALNIQAVANFGSVEFRHHPGSFKSEEVLEWANIILCLKKSIKDNIRINYLLELEPIDALTTVFGDVITKVPSLLSSQSQAEVRAKNIPLVEIINALDLQRDTMEIVKKVSRVKSENKLINQYIKKGTV